MEFTFDLQLFGGGGGNTTNVQSYEPSEYELQLQKASADYADAVAPNALWLNNVARGVLQDSLGTVQVDYDALNKQAQEQIYQYMADMYNTVGDNTNANRIATELLGNAYNQIPGVTNEYVNATNDIIRNNTNAANATNNQLADISSAYGRNANQANDKLGGLIPQYNNIAAQANSKLGGLADRGDDALADANSQLDRLLGKSETTLDKYGNIRDQLIRGEIPSPYLDNMRDAVAGTMRRTAGEGLNALANRGILNSSVTEGVLNDIEQNASDSVAARYLDNINTINSLLQGQSNDALGLLGQQANLIGQRFGNTGNTLDRNLNIVNTQAANSNNALGQAQNIINTQTANNTNALGQQGNLAQQQLGNINTANQNNANLIGQQYQNKMNGLNQQTGLVNQYLQNTLTTNAQNAGTLNNLLGHTTDNITTAAAAQEAAQQPASNLWNMSLGLNNSTNGALASAAGKGTTTTTTSRSGGGFMSGLFGGLF